MDLLDSLHVADALHVVSQALLVPTVACLLALIAYAVYAIGSFLVEARLEHRHYQVELPRLVRGISEAPADGVDGVIDGSRLLNSQKAALHELVSYCDLPEDARTEVAKRLMADMAGGYEKAVGRTDLASKVAPMLGLCGTLIPLGPGIVALGGGDTQTLSDALLVAFDTTVAGLVTAVACFAISHVRRRWYADYLVSMEAAMNTILEKAATGWENGGDADAEG